MPRFHRSHPHKLPRVMLVLALASVATQHVRAQELVYPNKPVRMIVSYAAGNVTDLMARMVADKLAAKWGHPVTVDNKPGQGGSVGAQLAARAPADGYTLLVSAMAAMVINPHVYQNVGYDVQKDFIPIINVASTTSIMVATPGLAISNFPQLVAYSKANPTALSYGTAGNGTVPHLNMELIKQETGLIAQHVPYKAAATVLNDVLGGRIQLQSDSISVLMRQIQAKRVVPIATNNSKRLPQLPDVPTLSEVVPGLTPVVPWLGIFAPLGTPPAIVSRIARDVTEILVMPDVKEKFGGVGLSISAEGSAAFAQTIAKDYVRLGKLARTLNLKVD
ncbi:Bug family tripartite tricarboxylate transporter substrate binding protein [Ottowia thiooxydans]|uniref:Bug family tripartite tricarboxylate transporter substrate binding protein n=1 Tax=Ottowia thiooxydans TaxID=219182 RepID=UPI0003FD0CAB|nr:tripartite tricarboxylate transporter substrate-binding protein [Ottowia thiooxydans]